MRLAERYSGVIGYFLKNNPVAQTELVFRDPYELIVSVVLSAQCTDRRVNMTTPELFKRYPTVRHLAAAEPEEVLELIKSISYPNSKARHLVGLARKLLSDFGGEVPSDVDLLMTLPGPSLPWTPTYSACRTAWACQRARRPGPWNWTSSGTSPRNCAPSRTTG